MDGLMGRYHVRAKTRDAITRLFYHFIDMAATNAYILYRRINVERLMDSDDVSAENVKRLELPDFREEIAAGLVTYTQKRSVGRPTSSQSQSSRRSSSSRPSTPQADDQQPGSSKPGQKAKHPVDDVRFDNMGHWPIWLSKEGGKKWCKLCKKSQTQCVCSKCDLHLCCSNAKNCFYDYHAKK